VNETILKFGYPETLVADYSSWLVLLRPQQVTLGALILACKETAQSFGTVSSAGCEELARVTSDLERALKHAFGYDKINYLMLMMIDPDVHFHVVPRYADARSFAQNTFEDPGWPGPPRLDHATNTDDALNNELIGRLKEVW
jgi:diadenosine tetraphosphate (Ap4A) HIT family hydrolase